MFGITTANYEIECSLLKIIQKSESFQERSNKQWVRGPEVFTSGSFSISGSLEPASSQDVMEKGTFTSIAWNYIVR